MKTHTEEIRKKLNALIEKNKDAEKGFIKAAENAKAKSLVVWFTNSAIERKKFNQDLKLEISSFEQDSNINGSLTGDIHRTWMELKSLLAADNDKAMLQEAIKGEKAALKEYNNIFNEVNLPSTTKTMLTSQWTKIKNNITILSTLDNIEFQEES